MSNPLELAMQPDHEVQRALDIGAYKTPRPSMRNAVTVLSRCPSTAGRWRMNTFARRPEVRVGESWQPITDEVEDRITHWLDERYDLRPSSSEISRAINFVANDNKVHPVQDYLTSCPWDGVPRIDTFAIDHLGAADTPLHRMMGRRFLLSCVARVMDPGCKVDTVLVLFGEQDMRKSSTLNALVPVESWFADTGVDLRSKDAFINMAGTLIYEFAELDSVARQDTNYVKAFLSSKKDKYRPPFCKRDIEVPRGVVFVATTNDREFLRDSTGNRRFHPIAVIYRLDPARTVEERDQIWGEAYRCWLMGGEERRWWFEKSEQPELDRLCEEYTQQHHWLPDIAAWLRTRGGAPFTTANVLNEACRVQLEHQTSAQARDVVAILRVLGARPIPRRHDDRGKYVRRYVAPLDTSGHPVIHPDINKPDWAGTVSR